jgi:hypothetical protein
MTAFAATATATQTAAATHLLLRHFTLVTPACLPRSQSLFCVTAHIRMIKKAYLLSTYAFSAQSRFS